MYAIYSPYNLKKEFEIIYCPFLTVALRQREAAANPLDPLATEEAR